MYGHMEIVKLGLMLLYIAGWGHNFGFCGVFASVSRGLERLNDQIPPSKNTLYKNLFLQNHLIIKYTPCINEIAKYQKLFYQNNPPTPKRATAADYHSTAMDYFSGFFVVYFSILSFMKKNFFF